ncbi:von Willebrand factor A domain-containing protein 5A [Chelonia mydas]|uniref:von Willebrand factor A domain-containing protein 5A n=1 Tax=Chelonia mydas TaxID=8469 RepID=M7C169_CHEMY|nr:von Willebrand factor A domain-containing protein 5A [Chelonia mydas]
MERTVPLRSGSVTVLIRGFVADVGCELLYRNDEPGPVEAVFVFPVDAEAAVSPPQARLGGACIEAQLREKKQAQELYGDALAGGQSSFLLQQEGAAGDIFSCSLGNLPPGEEAALTLRYVCELSLEPDGAARYVLPAVLCPRYTPDGWDGEDVTQGVPRVPQGKLPYTLSLSATLQSPHGIDRVLSNCSLSPLSYTSGNRTTAQVSLAEAPPWDRDVELLVYYAEPHKPSAVLEIGLPGAEPASPPRRGPGEARGSCPPTSQSDVTLSRQLFVFTDGEVVNTQEVITEVQHHRGTHRCFSFGIGDGASTALVKGIARAAGGSAEFITGQDRMQPKALQSLKQALQPAVTQISLSWDLPPGMEAELLGRGPEVIFPGQRCLIYARLRGQPQPPDTAVGGVTLQYRVQDQTYKEMLQFPLQPQDGDRLPVHRLAAKSLLLELEGAMDTGSEGDQHRALATSLASGVICSLTAYVGVDTERGQPVQGPLVRRDIPLAGFGAATPLQKMCYSAPGPMAWAQGPSDVSMDCAMVCDFEESLDVPEWAPEESPLLRLVSLQNADGSWDLDPQLAAALGVSETDARGRMPRQDVPPGVWATVLAVVWLHGQAAGQCDEWELLEAKAVGWVRGQAGTRLSECLEAANTLLGCSVGPAVFGL